LLRIAVSRIGIIVLIGLIAGGYTLLGGLATVIYTDFVQNILLILGGTLTLVLGVQAIGGIGVSTELRTATSESPGLLVHPADHKIGRLPVATGVLTLGIHGHCTDHNYAQRVLAVLAILWAPMIGRFQGLYGYLMALWTFMAPPVVVCVLASIFYPKANTRAAAATLIVGVVLGGYGFFGIDYPKQSTGLAYLSNPFNIGFLTLIACVLVMVLVSQFTQASDDDLEKTAAVTAARTTDIDEIDRRREADLSRHLVCTGRHPGRCAPSFLTDRHRKIGTSNPLCGLKH